MKDILQIIIAFGVICGIVVGGLSFFAKADDLRLVEMRLDQKIVSDQVSQTQSRIWQLEDRNKGRPCSEWQNQDEKNEYRKLVEQKKELDEKQKALMKK